MSNKLELRNVKTNARLSEETICFSGDLFFNGKKVAEASNHGHGGPNDFRPTDAAGFKKAEAFAKTFPAVKAFGQTFKADLEGWISDELNRLEKEKVVKRQIKSLKDTSKKVSYLKNGSVYSCSSKGAPFATVKASLLKREPKLVFCAEMTEAKLTEVVESLIKYR